jgi:hypothetical protein
MQPPNKRPIFHCDHPPNRLEQVAQFSTVTMAQFSTVTDTLLRPSSSRRRSGVFDKLEEVLVLGASYAKIADGSCTANW